MDLFQRIKEQVDIVEVVSQYVNLKRTGTNFTALCPFHNEKTPSFVVSPQKQIFHCFGCGIGGDVIKFLSEIEGLSNFDAAVKLAKDYNIQFELKEKESKIDYYEITKTIAEIYHKNLKENLNKKEIKNFINKRNITEKIIEKFYLGYAPDSYNFIINKVKKKDIPFEVYEHLGIIKKKENYYDTFRNRIIFPIRNIRGDIIAFGGRILDDSLPKYLNSPESKIYHKRKNLYGLFENKESIKKEQEVIVVEGYMDLISLYSAGIKNCVATLGTAFTEEQLALIKRFTDKIIFLYDGDKAGIKSSIRGAIISINHDINPKLILLPEGKDPDDFIKEQGVEEFLKLKDNSFDIVNYIKNIIFKKINLKYLENKIKLMERLKKIYLSIDNPVYRDHFIKGMSEILELNYFELKNYFHKKAGKRYFQNDKPSKKEKIINLEEKIISILFNNSDLLEQVNISFFSKTYQDLIELFIKGRNIKNILENEEIDDKLKSQIRELLLLDIDKKYFQIYYNKLKENFYKNRLKQLTNKIKELEENKEHDKILSLIKEKENILFEIKELHNQGGLV